MQQALLAFIELYARRHLDLYERRHRGLISAEEFSIASRRLTAIQATIQSHWLDIQFALPPEYIFDPRELSDLIQTEIAGCQHMSASSIKTIPGRESLIEALVLVDSLLMPWLPDDEDDDPSLFSETPTIGWGG